MLSDPAVEAAQRAWMTQTGSTVPDLYFAIDLLHRQEINAAREALAPIRDLHRPERPTARLSTTHCVHCLDDWPCATAQLIYPNQGEDQ
ncbi:MAG: hypothetical protein QM658_17800 [Gordonia sp. (in: high G+C Gram-positive bacteria)]